MPLDLKPPRATQKPLRDPGPPGRYIDTTDGVLKLIEIRNGDVDLLGQVTTHAEAESIAWDLVNAVGPRDGLPMTLHKLCVAYLAARGKEVLS